MRLAGLVVDDHAIQWLCERLDEMNASETSECVRRALERETDASIRIVDREYILRALVDPPAELTELRAALLEEHVWRRGIGLV